MYIIVAIITLAFIMCLLPLKSRYVYMYIAIFALAGLALFMWPDNKYDLYRHYLTLEKYRTLNFSQVLNLTERSVGTTITEQAVDNYISAYPVYSTFAWFISKIGIYQLLPFLTIFIIYILPVYRIQEIAKKRRYFSRVTAILFILMLLSNNYFFMLSNIRQPLASAIFAFVLYEDLVNKRNKLFCFVAYIMVCFIHSSGYMFLGLRIVLLFYNQYTRYIIYPGIFVSHTILTIACKRVMMWGSGMLAVAAGKYIRYTTGRANIDGSHVSYKLLIMYLIVFFVVVFFVKMSSQAVLYNRYASYIFLCITFCMTMTGQSEIFNRFEFLIVPLALPLIQELLHEYSGYKIFGIRNGVKHGKSYLLIYAIFIAVICINFGIACVKDYRIMTPYYSVFNYMNNGTLDLPEMPEGD
ncbi:hypothetical protein [uncultured Clostridium sp.]|uniref:hypothetical protein n=1 Tax=uncultured Clostridium sp. TaxID=59620 RepID=UPI0025ECE756|nr:hypothetical protein [uncultured Clostridium sp.]